MSSESNYEKFGSLKNRTYLPTVDGRARFGLEICSAEGSKPRYRLLRDTFYLQQYQKKLSYFFLCFSFKTYSINVEKDNFRYFFMLKISDHIFLKIS